MTTIKSSGKESIKVETMLDDEGKKIAYGMTYQEDGIEYFITEVSLKKIFKGLCTEIDKKANTKYMSKTTYHKIASKKLFKGIKESI